MEIQEATSPDVEVIEAAIPEVEVEEAPIPENEGSPEGEVETPAEPEFIDVEVNGKTVKVPAEARDAVLMHKDYTHKTQSLAAEREAFQNQRAQIQSMDGQEFAARATLMNVDQQLQQFQNVDFQAALAQANANYDEDAKANINAAFMKFTQLKDLRTQALGVIGQVQQQRSFHEQQATAKQLEQGRAELTKAVPGWNDDLKAKLVTYAGSFGFSAQELSDIEADPRAARVLHAAFLGADHLKKQQTAARVTAGQATQPAVVVKGTSARTPVRADTNDFAAFERLADSKLKKATK